MFESRHRVSYEVLKSAVVGFCGRGWVYRAGGWVIELHDKGLGN